MNYHHPLHVDDISGLDAELLDIALANLRIATFRKTGRTDWDYPIVSVTRVHDALRAAYALGVRDRRAAK